MKILNLYAGIGGNRKLWGDEHDITAVEYKPEIAAIYQDLYPNDKVLVEDAHDFLQRNYYDFDFIWSSPPCQSHSKARFFASSSDKELYRKRQPPLYPDMKLYQEILFLKHYARRAKWVVENVIGYYTPLIPPQEFERHYWWSNFFIPDFKGQDNRMHEGTVAELTERKGIDLSKYSGVEKRLLLRNCVEPELGKHILDAAMSKYQAQDPLFV